MDEVDVAQERVDRATASAVAGVKGALAGAGAEQCEECGAIIPAERRDAMPSARTCLPCQRWFEGRRR